VATLGPSEFGRAGPGTVVDVTHDGSLVGVAWPNHLVNVYDAETGEAVRGFKTDAGRPSAVAVSPDGSRMAIGFAGAPVAVWTFRPRWDMHLLDDATRGAAALAFSSDGRTLACWQGDTLSAWRIPRGGRLLATRLPVTEAERTTLQFFGDGQAVAVLSLGPQSFEFEAQSIFVKTGKMGRFFSRRTTDRYGLDTPLFPTPHATYYPESHEYEFMGPADNVVPFTATFMRWSSPAQPGGQANLFELDFPYAAAEEPNALAFDHDVTRAAYASTDGRVYLMHRSRPGNWRRGAAPWVALGLGGALILWLLLAWRPGARHVEVEKRAVAAAAERLGEGKPRMPVDLFILTYLIALSAVASIVSMIVAFAFGGGQIDLLAFLNLFAAAGLLKFRRGWRWFVLFELWAAFLIFGLFAGLSLTAGTTPIVQPIWGGVWDVSGGILWGTLPAFAAVYTWACLTLTRFHTRVLFAKAAAGLPRRPWPHRSPSATAACR